MNVRKFIANDARLALKKVKETLGSDAVILSNRSVDGHVEIMAVASKDMAMIVPGATGESTSPRLPSQAVDRVTLSSGALQAATPLMGSAQFAKNPALRRQEFGDYPDIPRRGTVPVNEPVTVAVPAVPPVSAVTPDTAMTAEMMEELKSLRRLVEQHLAGYAWGEQCRTNPQQTALLRKLLDVGFSPELADRWLSNLEPNVAGMEALSEMKQAVEGALPVLSSQQDLIERGGIYALVGPTGVGKTTTTAKLAARCVLRHGREKVALITADGYRIGAHEQLRIYGRILGVPVYVVRDSVELQQTLRELSTKHLVLIDTMGMSQRDKNVSEQTRMFDGCNVQRLLLLPATARGDTMDDVVSAYAGSELAGCVLTKIDEAVSLAPAVDTVIRHRLPVAFVCNGQRVPEDLHLPNRAYLVHRAFKETPDDSAHRSRSVEPMLAMASAGLLPSNHPARHV